MICRVDTLAWPAVIACALALAACTSPGGDGTPPPPTATTSATVATATPTTVAATPAATPAGPPHRVDFARGELVDVSPAVVFVDTSTGASTAWVFPAARGSFGVGPAGDYIVWPDGERMHLFRTDDGHDRVIDAQRLPITYGPGDAGFVALTQTGGDATLTAFDAHGEPRADLASVNGAGFSSADWGARAIAIATRGERLRVAITTSADAAATPAVDVDTPSRGGASIHWSHAGDRLAVVTADTVRVLDVTGETLGQASGEFYGNPRWSPDDAYLYVNAMPWRGGDLAYVFDADASPVFRYVSRGGTSTGLDGGYGYGCGGEVWLDDRHFGFEDRVISVDGAIAPVPAGVEPRYHQPADFGVVVVGEAGPDLIEIPGGHLQFLDDGRFVFQTIGILSSHGGCAVAVTLDATLAEGVQRPPYDDSSR